MVAEAIGGKFGLRTSTAIGRIRQHSAPTVMISGLKLRDGIKRVP